VSQHPLPAPPPAPAGPPPPRLLDQLRAAARGAGHGEDRVAEFASWVVRYIRFHGKRHPRELGRAEVGRFLEHVVRTECDPLPALEAARGALDFLYRAVLHAPLGELPRPQPPRLLDQMRQVLRVRHYSPRTEECYVDWARRFIRFHGLRHPRDMGAAEAAQFLTHLAVAGRVSARPLLVRRPVPGSHVRTSGARQDGRLKRAASGNYSFGASASHLPVSHMFHPFPVLHSLCPSEYRMSVNSRFLS
jgi:hypothetical protein